MQGTDFIWMNGHLVPWDQAKVHALTHTLHYAGGTFEGIRFYKTKNGPAIFRLEEHVDRLIYSSQVLKMPLEYTKQQIIDAIILTVRQNKLEAGYIRPLFYYGYGKMGVNPLGSPVDFMIACWPWGAYHNNNFIDVKISSYIRIHPDSTQVNAKLCGHYLNSMLALLELRGTHYHEALLLDHQGYISEGSAANFFMVKDGVLLTPKLGTALPGITRKFVIELAKSLGHSVIETTIKPSDLDSAEEAFFTGTAAEITPIRSIDDRIIGQNKIGKMTQELQEAFTAVVTGNNPAYQHLLTQIPKLVEI